MKKYLMLFVCAYLLSSCCAQKVPNIPANEPPLDKVVSVIQQQYAQALDTLNAKKIGVEINEADLSLQVSKISSASADISVWVVKPYAKYINTRSTKVTYILKKQNVQAEKGGSGFIPKDNSLRDLIINAATKFHNLKTKIGDLTQDSFSLDIIFAVEWDKSITLTFKIFGQGTEAIYENDSAVQHELVLTFKPTNP
jgi:hypothetical protein